MKEENVLRAIIVVKDKLTPFAKQAVKEMSVHGYRMEYFRDAELLGVYMYMFLLFYLLQLN
jgi:hypothetical protein